MPSTPSSLQKAMIFFPSRYDWLEGAGPRQTASSANLTCGASRSASEKTATERMPIFLMVRKILNAISPRLATNIFFICLFYFHRVSFNAVPPIPVPCPQPGPLLHLFFLCLHRCEL